MCADIYMRQATLAKIKKREKYYKNEIKAKYNKNRTTKYTYKYNKKGQVIFKLINM